MGASAERERTGLFPEVSAEGDGSVAGFGIVSSEALLFFSALVSELGSDPASLFEQVRLDPATIVHRDSVVDFTTVIQLLELAAQTLGQPSFGLRLAERQRGGRVIGPIGVVMKNSKTLGQALGYCAKHIRAYSLATRVRFLPDRARHRLFVGLEILVDAAQTVQAVEHALLLATQNICDITGGHARVRMVSFRHAPLAPARDYRARFGCPVLFNEPRDGVLLTEDDLLCPIRDADEQVYEMATSFVENRYPEALPPLHARVRALVGRRIGATDCTAQAIAAELCVHPRTLQRRLKAEGVSFEDIKDDVRRELALEYLERSEMPLSVIAGKLGYSEASVLSRSCYRWFSAPPRTVRQRAVRHA